MLLWLLAFNTSERDWGYKYGAYVILELSWFFKSSLAAFKFIQRECLNEPGKLTAITPTTHDGRCSAKEDTGATTDDYSKT